LKGTSISALTLSFLWPEQDGLSVQTIEINQQTLTVCLSAIHLEAACPLCSQLTTKIQSTYQRQLADLNWANFSLQLHLSVRRFYCLNPACKRKIFCERLAQLTRPYGRRTNRLRQFLQTLALALGGRPAARLAKAQSLKTSRPSLLRLLEQLELPNHPTPRVLGVDEFALKRGQTYAALLVDLETHQPIEVLPDRSSETFGNWLKAHSGIEIISRDRASSFAKAARLEAPQAQQVADRFHILVRRIGAGCIPFEERRS
jgi:transposase